VENHFYENEDDALERGREQHRIRQIGRVRETDEAPQYQQAKPDHDGIEGARQEGAA